MLGRVFMRFGGGLTWCRAAVTRFMFAVPARGCLQLQSVTGLSRVWSICCLAIGGFLGPVNTRVFLQPPGLHAYRLTVPGHLALRQRMQNPLNRTMERLASRHTVTEMLRQGVTWKGTGAIPSE